MEHNLDVVEIGALMSYYQQQSSVAKSFDDGSRIANNINIQLKRKYEYWKSLYILLLSKRKRHEK